MDGWLIDVAAFMPRTQRVVWNEHWVGRLGRRRWPFVSTGAPAGCLDGGEEATAAGNIPKEGDERNAVATNHATGVAFPDAVVATG